MNNTKKIIDDTYQAFMRGDLEYIVDACIENVDWSYFGCPGVPLIGNFQDRSGVQKFFDSLRFTIKPLDYQVNEFIVDGDAAVVLGKATVYVQTTGKTFEHHWCHVYTLRSSKIATFRGFTSNPEGMAKAFI